MGTPHWGGDVIYVVFCVSNSPTSTMPFRCPSTPPPPSSLCPSASSGTQARVVQGKEPEQFLSLFKGNLFFYKVRGRHVRCEVCHTSHHALPPTQPPSPSRRMTSATQAAWLCLLSWMSRGSPHLLPLTFFPTLPHFARPPLPFLQGLGRLQGWRCLRPPCLNSSSLCPPVTFSPTPPPLF